MTDHPLVVVFLAMMCGSIIGQVICLFIDKAWAKWRKKCD